MLASQAAQPFLAGQPAPADSTPQADPCGGTAAGAGTGTMTSGTFSTEYAMSLLARITHASADQALALIQGMSTPIGLEGL